jgi:signal transduction histidine kinase
LDEGLPAEVARTGQAVRIPEISLGDQRRRIKRDSWPFLERVGVYSLVLAPLRVGGRILGTVEVSRDQPGRPYTEEDALLLQDLADRAALALEAGRRFEQSLAAVRARDEVLGAVSHDLKSPLTGIVGSAQLVQRDLARRGLADEPLARQVERIVSATQRMGRMMEELVDAVRLDAGQPLVLRRSLTDLVMLVQAAVAEQEATSPQHQLRVSATESEVFGDWDAARLRRVLDNLLSNAIKYSPAGGEVQVEVGTQVEAGRRWAVLRVSDQGVGIPARDLPHIFERFRRGRNVGNIAGTGIGLAGARGIVQQHGGSIEVASQEGQGSTFTVRLPLREAPRAWATPDGLGR